MKEPVCIVQKKLKMNSMPSFDVKYIKIHDTNFDILLLNTTAFKRF